MAEANPILSNRRMLRSSIDIHNNREGSSELELDVPTPKASKQDSNKGSKSDKGAQKGKSKYKGKHIYANNLNLTKEVQL